MAKKATGTKAAATKAKAKSGEELKEAITGDSQDTTQSQTPTTPTVGQEPTQETQPGSTPVKALAPLSLTEEEMEQTMPPELETLKTRPVPPSPPMEEVLGTDQSSDGEGSRAEEIKAKAQRQMENLLQKSEELELKKADVVVTEDSLEVVTESRI